MKYAKLLMVLGVMFALCGMGKASAGQPGGGGNFDPEAFRKRMQDRIKEQLGSTDEEWKALQPKIEAVQKAQADARTGGGFGGFGGGGRGGRGGAGGGGQPQDEATKTEVQKKNDALKTLLDNKDSDPKAVQEALKSLREQKEKAKEGIKKAQTELKELLTAKQEAQLVLSGMLE